MKDFKDYKQIENAGWDNMHSLLDQHMPQKKRRFAFLYFTGFIFGVLLLISFLSWLNYKGLKQMNHSKQIPITMMDSKKEMTSEDKMTVPVEDHSIETTGREKLNPEFVHSETASHSSNKINAQTKFNAPGTENNNSNLVLSSSELTKDQSAVQNEMNQKEMPASTNHTVNIELIDIHNLPCLPIHSIQSQQSDNSTRALLLPVFIHPVANKPTEKIQFGIQTGLQYFTSNKTISYIAGVQANYKLSEKWSISVSPTLEINKGNFLVLNDEEQSIILNSLDSFRVNTKIFDTNFEDVLANPASGLNTSQIKKYNTLYNLLLPVSINYHVNKHWQVAAGLKLSIPLHHEILSSSKSNIIQWDDPNTSTWNVKPINYFVQAGIHFHPWNSFGISLEYSFLILKQNAGLNNFSASTNPAVNAITENNLRHFSASMNYRF